MTLNPRLSPSGPLLNGAGGGRHIAVLYLPESTIDILPGNPLTSEYLEATIEPNVDYQITGSALFLTSGNNTCALNFAIEYSANEGVSWLPLLDNNVEATDMGPNMFRQELSGEFDSADLGDAVGPVWFRLYAHGTGPTSWFWKGGAGSVSGQGTSRLELDYA